MKYLKKFYRPFAVTYILLSVALGYYPTFDFFSLKGQIIIFTVSIFNGLMGIYVRKL
tara:strand:+ start:112 stop:282 length:171 start_codon:yes stop_codon:yes gene_type:complete